MHMLRVAHHIMMRGSALLFAGTMSMGNRNVYSTQRQGLKGGDSQTPIGNTRHMERARPDILLPIAEEKKHMDSTEGIKEITEGSTDAQNTGNTATGIKRRSV